MLSAKEYFISLETNLIEVDLKNYEDLYWKFSKEPLTYRDSDAELCKVQIVKSLENIKTNVLDAIKKSESKTYAVLTTKKNLDNFETYCKDAIDL